MFWHQDQLWQKMFRWRSRVLALKLHRVQKILQDIAKPWLKATAFLAERFCGNRHPVIVDTRDNKDYARVPSYSSYTTIAGWGPPTVDSWDGELGYIPQRGSGSSRSRRSNK